MPRLFTALQLPASVAMQLSLLQRGLPSARWIDRENLHITLRFMGDVEKPVAQELAYALEGVKSEPFTLSLSGLEVFGSAKPHSLYAAVRKSEPLLELQAEHERICRRLGIVGDKRKFTPHVTIARLRSAKPIDIAKYLSGCGLFTSASFDVDRFVLLSSRDSVGGGPYLAEETYQLVARQQVHA